MSCAHGCSEAARRESSCPRLPGPPPGRRSIAASRRPAPTPESPSDGYSAASLCTGPLSRKPGSAARRPPAPRPPPQKCWWAVPLPPPIIVVVHGRQVVVHEGIGVDAFHRAGQGKRLGFVSSAGRRCRQAQRRAEPLAAREK